MRLMPAEWERHDCCWMAWPDHPMWEGILPQVEAEYAAVAQAIRQFEPVRVIANPHSASRARNLLGADIDVLELPLDDAWFRDAGPSFVRRDDGGIEGVCWRFNGWGGANAEFEKDAALGRATLDRVGLPAVTSALAMEGGALAVDGAGTLLTTETVVFNQNRNPGLTRQHAEAEFARTLGIRKVIWLPGNTAEFGTDGHIDGIACFVRPGVVLFEDPAIASGPGFDTAEGNRRALEGQTDAEGRPIELIFIREAPPLAREGQGDWGYCRSYINFYIANGGVVMPKFGIPEDDAARDAVAAAFPDRTVVQVDVSTVSQGGGGIHCITQQQPAV
ncbi:agmatine deiminase family protein [Hwanghaeella grinnelliae]|uniref:Agmatine deiminase family protein n=1 Tax=Hwanghaeella grinnelliae TaxID=2500179 RepID=A0A3S2W730_9PROT|nr:agmatine deiminase family protein [Hwanghaeella grinnelliae]RVU38867.1 agmatine deiminase family protein [Hwanghaeella grinnelliae]